MCTLSKLSPAVQKQIVREARHRGFDGAAMLRLLIGDEPGFLVDPRELHRPGPSYTADTLRELTAEHSGAALFLVIGADQLQPSSASTRKANPSVR